MLAMGKNGKLYCTDCQEAKAEIKRLEDNEDAVAKLYFEYKDRCEVLEERLKHAHYWYAVRIERLKDLAKEKGIWHEVASILANGTLTGIVDGKPFYEPPTYASQMNALRYDVEKLQKELADAKEEIAKLHDKSKPDESP